MKRRAASFKLLCDASGFRHALTYSAASCSHRFQSACCPAVNPDDSSKASDGACKCEPNGHARRRQNATESAGAVCVPMVVMNRRLLTSHSRIVSSSPAEATSRPSGEKATLLMRDV